MKRLIAATAALTMLGSTAAMAHDYRGYHGHYRRHHHSNVGPAIAVGLGIAALAIIASSHSDRDRYERRGYYRGPNGYYYRNRGYYERYQRGYGDRGYYGGDRYRDYDDD